jgi:deazaflavin-dependent oxidoreductase (nitroreductase family)
VASVGVHAVALVAGGDRFELSALVYGDHIVLADLEGDALWPEVLLEHSDAVIEMGGASHDVRVRRAEHQERAKLAAILADDDTVGTQFSRVERRLAGGTPIVVLDRLDTYERKRAINRQVIENFRANTGKVNYVTEDGVALSSIPLLLLHHVGRKSGLERVNPLQYREIANGFAVVATNGGSAWHPDWYLNLMAAPETIVEVGGQTVPVRARDARPRERAELGPGASARDRRGARFGAYNEFIVREVPLVILERREVAEGSGCASPATL